MPTTTRKSTSGLQPLSTNVQRPNTPGKMVKSLQAELNKKESENKDLRGKVDELTKALDSLNLVKDKIAATSTVNIHNNNAEGGANKKKDKDAPVPAKTAYKFFCEASPAPTEGVDMRVLWKECAPEQRQTFNAMAQADKARFETEIAAYQEEKMALELYYKQQKQNIAMEFYEAHQAAQAAIEKAEADKKKKKSKKDPEAPKRSMSSYLYFAQEKREGVMKKNPTAPPAEISKILGEMWKETKNTKKYDKMAADAKNKYDEEKIVYDAMMKARKEAEEQEKVQKLQQEKEEALKMYKSTKEATTNISSPVDDISVLTDDNTKSSKNKKKKDPNAPKRALSAYNFFLTENQKSIKASMTGDDVKQADVLKEVGRQWKELSEKKKSKYNKSAEQDKARYNKEMEAYNAKNKSV